MVKIRLIESKDKFVDLSFDKKSNGVFYGKIFLNGNEAGFFKLDTKKMVKHGYLSPITISNTEIPYLSNEIEVEVVNKRDFSFLKEKFSEDGGRVLTAIIDFLNLDKKDILNLYGFLKKYTSLLNVYMTDTKFDIKFSDGTILRAVMVPNSFLCEISYDDHLIIKVPKTSSYSEKYVMVYQDGSETKCLEGTNFFVFFIKKDKELIVFYYRYKKDFQVKIVDLGKKETKEILHSLRLRELPMRLAFDAIDLFRAMKVYEVDDKKFFGFTLKDLADLYQQNYTSRQTLADKLVKDFYLRTYRKNQIIYYVEPDEWSSKNYGFTREV